MLLLYSFFVAKLTFRTLKWFVIELLWLVYRYPVLKSSIKGISFFGMIIQKRSNKDIIVGFKVVFLVLKFSSFKQIQVTIITKKSKRNHSSFLWEVVWKQNVINEWNFKLQRNFPLVAVAKRPNLSLRENDFLLHGIILISWKVLIIRSLRNIKGHTYKCIAVVSVNKCWTGKYYWHGDFSLCALNLYHTLSNCNDYYNIISYL